MTAIPMVKTSNSLSKLPNKPFLSPQETTFTPETILFSLAVFQEGKD